MQQYKIRIPFRLTHELAQALNPSRPLHHSNRQISIESKPPYIVLTAESFESESEASSFLDCVWGALAWTSAALDMGFTLNRQTRTPYMTDNPEEAGKNIAASFGSADWQPIDGLSDGSLPTIVPIGKRISYVTGGDVTMCVRRSSDAFVSSVQQALKAPAIARVASDERLRTAIEILTQSHFEDTVRARFVTLTSALEVLAESEPKHEAATAMLSEFHSKVLSERDSMDPSSESWHVLDDLQRDVLFRSKASIRSRIRHLALGAFASDPKAQEKSKRAVRAYDMRSKLVHDGNLSDKELSEGFEVSKETLRLALTTRIRQLAGIE